jgi:hypothetical protein
VEIRGLQYVQANVDVYVQPGSYIEVSALCPAGKKALGGGYVNIDGADIIVTRSVPGPDLNGWTVVFRNVGTQPQPAGSAYVVCAELYDEPTHDHPHDHPHSLASHLDA